MERKQRLAVLGSTGSIGTQTLDIVRNYPERFEITTLTAHTQLGSARGTGRRILARQRGHCRRNVLSGRARRARRPSTDQGLRRQTTRWNRSSVPKQVDTVVMALVGYSGLFPTASALLLRQKGRAGEQGVSGRGRRADYRAVGAHTGLRSCPVDSEHSAIFQCLERRAGSEVEKVILTASGGPFLNRSADGAPPRDGRRGAGSSRAGCMGAKVTIDSASLMNKGFEVIEARWLFGVDAGRIDVVIHPGSVVHSMVQFRRRSRQGPDRYARHAPADPVCAHLPAAPAARRQAARLLRARDPRVPPSRYRPLPEPGARLRMPAPGRLRGRGARTRPTRSA